jgi:hypothetical protein
MRGKTIRLRINLTERGNGSGKAVFTKGETVPMLIDN